MIPPPAGGEDSRVPPFWELEDLLATGLGYEAALQIMAARRAALTLVDPAEPAQTRSAGPAARRFKLVF